MIVEKQLINEECRYDIDTVAALKEFKNICNSTPLRNKFCELSDDIIIPNVTTADEISQWAKESLNIGQIDYTDFDVRIAGKFTKELKIFQNIFPQAISDMNWINTKQRQYKYFLDNGMWEQVMKSAIETTHRMEQNKYGEVITAEELIRSDIKDALTDNTYLEYVFAGNYNGIGFPNSYAFDYDEILAKRIKYHKTGRGSYSFGEQDLECDYRHEIGHAIHKYLEKIGKDAFVEELTKKFLKEVNIDYYKESYNYSGMDLPHDIRARSLLSKYATKNRYEFFAEAFCEYFSSPNPRKYAMLIGGELEKIFS